jgi:mRNA-degrading endonuclease RelE of RelBE toxin-antitoxin system
MAADMKSLSENLTEKFEKKVNELEKRLQNQINENGGLINEVKSYSDS